MAQTPHGHIQSEVYHSGSSPVPDCSSVQEHCGNKRTNLRTTEELQATLSKRFPVVETKDQKAFVQIPTAYR